ncbi:inner-membrane translocator [Roseobacter sp. AzwK-3b]|nr:inner-membrane translocator [Roseobacter sp. AzwK-3b]
MRLRLERRPQPARHWIYLSPVLAVLVTMLAGGALFAALGKNPVAAISTIFWEPLFGEFAFYYRPSFW